MQKSLTTRPPQRPRQPRKPKAEHLGMAFPAPPETGNPAFWLAVYLRDLAKHTALQTLTARACKRRGPGTDPVTQLALAGAMRQCQDDLTRQAKWTQESGLLLYAWPGTKFFDSAKPQ